MRLYHGSTNQVKIPVVERGRNNTDFGKGFYTTTHFEQAKKWALYKQGREKEGSEAIVSVYDVDDDLFGHQDFRIKIFDSPNGAWLSFVVDCRRGKKHEFDIVFGAVADDKIYATITLYESNILTTEETVARLKVNEFYNQVSFHVERAVKELRFVCSAIVTNETTIEEVG